jgi:mersacidin/lichenicidin family type 2 lantibiotic
LKGFIETAGDFNYWSNHMKIDVIKAWKDEAYRKSLSQDQLAQLEANPVAGLELSDEDMGAIAGGGGPTWGNSSGGPGGSPGPLTWTNCCMVE